MLAVLGSVGVARRASHRTPHVVSCTVELLGDRTHRRFRDETRVIAVVDRPGHADHLHDDRAERVERLFEPRELLRDDDALAG